MKRRRANVGLKLVAAALACVVYGLVYLDQDHETTIHVPFEVADMPDDLLPLDPLPETVTLRVVAGGREIARRFLAGRAIAGVSAVVRVPDDVDVVDRALTPLDVVVPLGTALRVVEVVDPQRVVFRLDARAEARVPVVPILEGTLPRGYVLSGRVTVVPDSVTVFGPRSIVSVTRHVSTETVDLVEERRPFHEIASLVHDERLRTRPARVTVRGDVEPERQLVVRAVSVVVRNRHGLIARPEPPAGSVTLLGPESRIRRLDELAGSGAPTGLSIVLDAAGLGTGEHALTPVVELDPYLRLVAVEPPRFALRLLAPESSAARDR